MKRTNDPSSQSVKNNGKIILYHSKQNVTRVITYGAKCAFKKFRVQSVI